jgi:hypothetical protein
MFLRLLDIAEMRNEKKAARANKPFKRVFSNPEADKTKGPQRTASALASIAIDEVQGLA